MIVIKAMILSKDMSLCSGNSYIILGISYIIHTLTHFNVLHKCMNDVNL
jgi:hypothetical protein